MRTVAPVKGNQPNTEVLVLQRDGSLFTRLVDTRPFKALNGWLFAADGYVWPDDRADNDRAQPWEIEARVFESVALPGFVLNVVMLAVSSPDAPLRVIRRWYDGQRVFDTIEPVRGDASPADWRKASRAQEALIRFSESLRDARGRHPEYDEANELQLLQVLASAVHAVVKQGGRATTASVAKELGKDRRTVKGWLDNSPWDLKAIQREAFRCTGPLRVTTCSFHVRHAAEYRRKEV